MLNHIAAKIIETITASRGSHAEVSAHSLFPFAQKKIQIKQI